MSSTAKFCTSGLVTRAVPETLVSGRKNAVLALPKRRGTNQRARWIPAASSRGYSPDRRRVNSAPLRSSTLDASPAVTSPAESAQEEEGRFEWTKNWYACHVIEYMDETRPYKFTLLGMDLVFWRDGEGLWRAAENKCPHRLAPLSEGRVEDNGDLLCAYHAWRFDGEGKCVAIPQAQSKEEETSMCSNPRSCAKTFPTRHDAGILWVWPESGADGLLASAGKEPPLPPELRPGFDEAGEFEVVQFPWAARYIEYGMEAFFENVTDPAHVPVSHHKIMGSRYNAGPDVFMPNGMEVKRPFSDEGGFHVGSFDWTPPNLMRIGLTPPGDADQDQTYLTLYATPTTPGRSMHLGNNLIVKKRKPSKKGKKGGFGMYTLPIPVWALHLLGTFFMHQDMAFLHHQEKILAKEDASWADACYMPTVADRATIMFRKWLERNGEEDAHGKKAVPWASISGHPSELPPASDDPKKLYNVYEHHTKHCKYCQGALKNVERLRLVATVAAVCCALKVVSLATVQKAVAVTAPAAVVPAASGILAAAKAAAAAFLPHGSVKFILLGAFFSLALFGLTKLRGLFYVVPYSHQDNP